MTHDKIVSLIVCTDMLEDCLRTIRTTPNLNTLEENN